MRPSSDVKVSVLNDKRFHRDVGCSSPRTPKTPQEQLESDLTGGPEDEAIEVQGRELMVADAVLSGPKSPPAFRRAVI